ncbi:MAG: exodeoxyribonuclease VII large subunit [Planctomycetota bacterium]
MTHERPPFDPARRRAGRSPEQGPATPGGGLFRSGAGAPPAPAVLSVRQVNDLVRGAIARHIPPALHVLGQISNLARPMSGHLYFTLKDAFSELQCVMWRSTAVRLRFAPEVGMEVIATGGLEVYPQRGSYQLIVRQLEPRGVGALEVAFRQLKERLEREGLFDPRRKRPLPRIPQRVALVTSPRGAAIRDILHALNRRYPVLDIFLFPVRVQGPGAAQEIAAAITWLSAHHSELGGIDVLIAGRGGGSLEDLWAFNEEVVARAIATCRIPVVSAVGHEVDVSISDLVADLRAPTPTAAAELITPTLTELCDVLAQRAGVAQRITTHALRLARSHLSGLLATESMARPVGRLRQRGQYVDELQHRLRHALVEPARCAWERLAAAELAILRFGAGRQFALAARLLEQRQHRLSRALAGRLLTGERRLTQRVARLQSVSPGNRLPRHVEHLQNTAERLKATVRSMLAHRRRLLEARGEAAAACDPRRVQQRGYSITRAARTRRVLKSVEAVKDGLRIVTQLADGAFHATADDPRQPRFDFQSAPPPERD